MKDVYSHVWYSFLHFLCKWPQKLAESWPNALSLFVPAAIRAFAYRRHLCSYKYQRTFSFLFHPLRLPTGYKFIFIPEKNISNCFFTVNIYSETPAVLIFPCICVTLIPGLIVISLRKVICEFLLLLPLNEKQILDLGIPGDVLPSWMSFCYVTFSYVGRKRGFKTWSASSPRHWRNNFTLAFDFKKKAARKIGWNAIYSIPPCFEVRWVSSNSTNLMTCSFPLISYFDIKTFCRYGQQLRMIIAALVQSFPVFSNKNNSVASGRSKGLSFSSHN